jgi:uncharacterized protein
MIAFTLYYIFNNYIINDKMGTKKIALFGATTSVGQCILNEALARGHEVTAIVPDINEVTAEHDKLKVVEGFIIDPQDVKAEVEDHDVVINAECPSPDNTKGFYEGTQSFIKGVKEAGVKRVIVVGWAPDGLSDYNSNETTSTKDWRAISEAYGNALALYQKEENIEWSYSHPVTYIETEIKGDTPPRVIDSLNNSNNNISFEDYAIALLDEVEKNKHLQELFAVTC